MLHLSKVKYPSSQFVAKNVAICDKFHAWLFAFNDCIDALQCLDNALLKEELDDGKFTVHWQLRDTGKRWERL